MITICAVLETGYQSSFEHLAFRQLKGAYGCRLVCVPHDFLTLQEALDSLNMKKVFMLPRGRVDSSDFDEWKMPAEDVAFILGSPQETLVSFVGDNTALHIATPIPGPDLMAVCVAGIILHVHR